MNFSSDNTAGAHPKISENIAKHSLGFASSYGASDLDKKVDAQLSEIFEKDVSAFFVATGTAANSLCLAATAKPGGITFCHEEAHIIMDECGAPEFFSNGSRLVPLAGREGKIDLEALSAKFEEFDPSFVHYGRPSAVSITQATEIGSVYKLDEIEAICDVAHKNDVRAHMDGARFANALVGHGCTPAQMTWKAGIDYLSFGGTKNGCWCAEALICFNDNMSEELAFLRKRSGQLFSKSRFIAAQFEAYLADGLWLELAKNANDAAQMLGKGVAKSANARLAFEPEANEVFAIMSGALAQKLQSEGATFYEWPVPKSHMGLLNENEKLYRLVANFGTEKAEVETFLNYLS